MNIAIITSSLAATGPGFVAQELANNFSFEGHNVIFVTLSQTNGDKILLGDKISIYELNSSNGRLDNHIKSTIQKLISDHQLDVIISNGIRSDYFNSKINNPGLLKVSISHNNPFQDYPQHYGFLKGYIMALLQFYQFRKLNLVITLNPTLHKLHKRLIGKKKVHLVMNGVPDDIYTSNMDKSTKHIFGNVGVFNHRKNQEFIIKTLAEEDIIFWGDGPLKLDLKTKYSNKNKIGRAHV